MHLIRRHHDPDQFGVIDLVLRIQNDEYQVGLTLSGQPDLESINASYRDAGGDFWIAEEDSGIRVGFQAISKEDLPVTYEYPDRDSLLFMLRLAPATLHPSRNPPCRSGS